MEYKSAIPQDWDFNKMGIGGLDEEFSAIFRRAFASRVFPPDVVEALGTYRMHTETLNAMRLIPGNCTYNPL